MCNSFPPSHRQHPIFTGADNSSRGRTRLENAFNVEEPAAKSTKDALRRGSSMRVDDQGVTRYGADHKDLDNSIGR